MPRLLIATTVPTTIRSFLLPFARHFRARGWQVDAMARAGKEWEQCAPEFDQTWQIPWSRNPLDPRNIIKAAPQVRDIVQREGYDLVHTHTPVASFVVRAALRQMQQQGQLAVCYTAHGFHFYRNGPLLRNAVFLGLEKIAGRWTDYLVVINREDAEAARRHRIVPPDRVQYMPGIGVDLEYYNPEQVDPSHVAQLRGELGLAPTDRLFVMVAEFIPRKRHKDVLQAVAQLQRPEVHVAFAGRGPLLEPMQDLAAQLNIANQMHFLGFRRDIPVLIRASEALLLASQHEGLPRSAMEALGMATPVIGSAIRGLDDLLNEAGGILYDMGDVAGLAQSIAYVLDNPEQARAIGQQGFQHIRSYDVQHIIELHETMYAHALEHTPARQVFPRGAES
jgi:glycosyltransferase involved in cell wall biosynthesis